MQKLIILSGSPCVGKSAAAELLYQAYQNSAYLDGDWCWCVNPFSVEDPRLREGDKAMSAVLSRLGNKLPPPVSAFQGIVGREPYPVADKAGEIIRRLIQFGVTRFRALFKGSRSRSEVVATFLAVLELCKARRLLLAGTETDCTVTCTQEEGTVEFTAENY